MKVAIITYIFGENKETLREPLVIDDCIEYICVTDQKNLKSKFWKVIVDDVKEANSTRDKMVYVKYNPFKYTDSELICVIDGTLEIKSSLNSLFESVNDNDMMIKKHPDRNNLYDELQKWIEVRNMPTHALGKFEKMSTIEKISLTDNFLIESCVLIYKKNRFTIDLCKTVLKYMKFLGEHDNLFLSNQCVLTFLLKTRFKNIKFSYINQKKYFNRYKHNTKKIVNK